MAAVYWTVPSRLLIPLSKWTVRDFGEYYDGLITQLRRTVQAEPACAQAQNSLGVVLARRGRVEKAIGQFQRVLEIDPDFAEAHHNLGDALAHVGRFDEAIGHYRKALEIMPDFFEAHNSLGDALAARGRLDEAIAQYGMALEIKPSSTVARNNLGVALQTRSSIDAAMARFQRALQLKPDDVDAQNNLAWLRATCPATSLRNGAAAIEHAQRANQICGGRRADVLNTLAAAYAEAGQFPQALATARKALELATQQNRQAWVDVLRSRIALYEAGKPYRQTLPASTPTP